MIVAFLDYLVAPSINPEVTDQTINEGNNASFTCQAIGEPIPTISWYFNDNPVNETTEYIIATNVLQILNVQSSDEGIYTCYATNVISIDSSSGRLTVNGKLHL